MKNQQEKIKFLQKILDNLLKNHNFDKSFDLAATELKLSKTSREKILKEFFENKINSFIEQLNNLINQQMQKELTKEFYNLRVNEKVKFLVIKRLNIINKFFDKNALLKLVLNQRSPFELSKMLFNISDEIWHLSGDKATDFNYYTKRLILMNIYVASFIYNLRDESDNQFKTNEFVETQIKLVLKFGKLKSKIMRIFNQR